MKDFRVLKVFCFVGDQKLAEFLEDEIKGETKSSPGNVSKVEGWEVKTDGTGVILTKAFKDEK